MVDGFQAIFGSFSGQEFTFNADVQPPPTITALSPGSGSLTGGTSVTITGTDLEGTKAVTFGGVPAGSFTTDSESQITATAPPAAQAGNVQIAVTTAAGTASSPFGYKAAAGNPPASEHCVVPSLRGKKLKASKKRLKKAHCKVGKVKLLGEATAKTGKVKRQNPKPGKILAPGSKVNVKLGS